MPVSADNHKRPSVFSQVQQQADLALSAGRFSEAEAVYLKALEQNYAVADSPDFASTANNYALLLQKSGRYQESESWLVKAINNLEAGHGEAALLPQLYHHLGKLYFTCGKADHALAMQEKALAMRLRHGHDDSVSDIHLTIGLAATQCGDLGKASVSFLKAADDSQAAINGRKKLEALICASSALMRMGHYVEAEAQALRAIDLGKLIATDGTHESAIWNMLGFSFAQRNRIQEAIQAYRTSLQIIGRSLIPDPLDLADAHFNLASLYAMQNECEQFEHHLGRAADLIDSHSKNTEARSQHFREVFAKHFHSHPPSVTVTDLKAILLLSIPSTLG